MRQYMAVTAIAVWILAASGMVVKAAPTQGLSIGAGISSTSYSEPGLTLNPAGVAFDVDFQVVATPNLTINPFLMLVSEVGEDVIYLGETFSTEFSYQIIGAQIRFWATDQFFIGGQLANHNVTLTVTHVATGNSASVDGSNVALGLAAGMELDTGLSVFGQYDAIEIEGSDFSSLRLILAYRFPSK